MLSFRHAATGLALAAALVIPNAAFAQQAPPPDAPAGPQQRHFGGGMHRFQNLNLSDQQKTQIQQIVQNFRQSHQNQPPTPEERQQLRQQIDAVLTPQQRTQLQQQEANRGEAGDNDKAPMGGRGMHHGGFMHAEMSKLTLSAQQKTQLQNMMKQFHSAHKGQHPTKAQMEQFHQQMLNVLTAQQRAQYEKDRQEWRAQHAGERANRPFPEPTATP